MTLTLDFDQTTSFIKRLSAEVQNFVPIDVPFDRVADTFRDCDRKLVQAQTPRGQYWREHLLWGGVWWCVGQTDLCDDVATVLCAEIPERAMTLQKLLLGKQYGARFHRWSQPDGEVVGALSVITHMTDG